MKLKHLESALEPVTKYSDVGTDNVNIDLEQYRWELCNTPDIYSQPNRLVSMICT